MRSRRTKITSEVVKDFWSFMGKKYKFSVCTKASSTEIKFIARMLGFAGIKDAKKFMEQYTTTLPWKNKVFTNFKIGEGSTEDLEHQIAVCGHEVRHLQQYRKNKFRFLWDYATSHEKRSMYEVDAYVCNLEMCWYQHKKLLDTVELAKKLKGYNCSNTDVKIATRFLNTAARKVKQGIVIHEVTNTAITWLETHR